jgi:hypothetical protein
MARSEPDNKYAVTFDDLEAAARVPLEDQTTQQTAAPPDVTDDDWLDARRQARLAGGA